MSLLRSAFSRTFALSAVRPSSAVPAVSLLSHQNRFFSNSPQNYKKDVMKNAPGWDEDNASESEADIKADREQLPRDVKELQRESVEKLHSLKNEGKTVGGFGSFNKAVNEFRHDFEQEVGSVEKKIHQKGESVLKDVKNTTETWKKSAEKEAGSWTKSAKKEADSVVNEIKKGAKEFVKKLGKH